MISFYIGIALLIIGIGFNLPTDNSQYITTDYLPPESLANNKQQKLAHSKISCIIRARIQPN